MDTKWKVEVLPSAQRELDVLGDPVRREATQAIADLGEDPFPPGHIRLEGFRDRYRIRFYRDQYRIVYRVSEQQQKVVVLRIRSRGTAYGGWEPKK
ncbi:MAG: type II toxin-antitoxin system RelE/ParE family toxin [Acidobacteria bacterium]|nr:type II toxin-antitoxin system RelE/ParE family toxin [Acidobacteriota bacterium]